MPTTMKYIFTAIFNDGSTIKQREDDISTVNPARSAFNDVVVKGVDSVSSFMLASEHATHVVHLDTGMFAINGVQFRIGDPRIQSPVDTKYRLIYYRRHTHQYTSGLVELQHQTEYVFGWQAIVDGQSVQQTMILI